METISKQQLIELRILAQHQIIAERLISNPESVIAHAKANIKRWSLQYAADQYPVWMQQWQKLLSSEQVDTLVKILTSNQAEDIQLRSSSPFAGILSAKERWRVIQKIQ